MLILSRRANERLFIGEDIIVHVIGIKGNQVRLGIKAPRDLPVHREEIYERIKQERLTKSQVDKDKQKEERDR